METTSKSSYYIIKEKLYTCNREKTTLQKRVGWGGNKLKAVT